MGRRFVPYTTIRDRMAAKNDRFSDMMRRRSPPILQPEVVPVVEVEIIRVPDVPPGPVVDVTLEPKPSRLSKLPTLADRQALPRAKRKDELETTLDRAIANKAARLDDARLLRRWAFAVKTRDQWKDRKTGARLLRTIALDPLRAEAHHVVAKDDWAVRYDVRNGIALSLASHYAVEQGWYRIEGTRWFTVKGSRYINCTYPVIFVRT